MPKRSDNSHTRRFIQLTRILKAEPNLSAAEVAIEMSLKRRDGRDVDVNNVREVMNQMVEEGYLRRRQRAGRRPRGEPGGKLPHEYRLSTEFGGLPEDPAK